MLIYLLMPQLEPIEIYYSKNAYRAGLFAAFIFVCGGFCIMTIVQNGALDFTIHPFTKFGLLGIVVMALGALLARVYIKKLADTSPALIIDDEGMTINGKKQKNITWAKIDRIEVVERRISNKTSPDKFIVPVLKDPEEYFNDTTKKLLGTLDNLNVEAQAGQPIEISTTFLQCSFDGLRELLENKLAEYNTKKQS